MACAKSQLFRLRSPRTLAPHVSAGVDTSWATASGRVHPSTAILAFSSDFTRVLLVFNYYWLDGKAFLHIVCQHAFTTGSNVLAASPKYTPACTSMAGIGAHQVQAEQIGNRCRMQAADYSVTAPCGYLPLLPSKYFSSATVRA